MLFRVNDPIMLCPLLVVRPDRFTSRINGLLDTQSSGVVKLTQPRNDSLPWPRGRAIRLNQRPIGVPLSVFRSVALADKHDRKC